MNVLVVSPHPDDETLGAGGTILRYKDEGHKVYWLNITAILTEYGWDKEKVQKKEDQIQRINKFYDFDGFLDLKLPTSRLESIDTANIIEKIGSYIMEIEPNVMILPDYNDVHSDHKKVFEWLYACSKSFRYPSVKKVMTMEIVSETDFGLNENHFVPNIFVDITRYADKKIEAMNIYSSEIGMFPFPRSEENIKALYTMRGATAGFKAAEGFRLVKEIM